MNVRMLTGLLLLASSCSAVAADTFQDNFDVVSYGNNDGTVNWRTNWRETNDDGDPGAGDLSITGGEFRLQNANKRLERRLDLGSYTTATLTFDYREVGFDNNRDQVFVEIRSPSTGWVRLARYRGRNVNVGSASLQIPVTNLEDNARIRIRSNNRLGATDRFFVDNFTVTAAVTVGAGDFADFFNVVAYSNQDGTRLFDTDWSEGGDDNNPTSGDVQITGGELALDNSGSRLTRELDLSGFSDATLTFDYREVGYDNNRDQTFVEIRSGGGAWTRIVRYRGANVNSGSASFTLPSANLAANTEIRFRTGGRTGNNDFFYVDNFVITVTVAITVTVDHFDISLTSGNFGINCVPHSIKVTAHDNLHGAVTGYTGQIQLATTTVAGDWSDGGLGNLGSLANGVAGDGVATYQFDAGDNGEADFFLDYTNGTDNTVGVDINDTTTVTLVDDSIETVQFAPTGFTVTASLLGNPPPNPINDPVATQTAGTDFAVHLAAYGQTPTDSACGVIEAYTGNKQLHFWMDYDDPVTGTLVPSVDGQATLNQECFVPGPPNCNGVGNGQTVTFTNGQASVTARYKDVGSINLNMKDDDYEVSDGHVISGATGLFVVKPDDFVITTIEDGAATANPGTTAAGAGFVAAGQTFRVVVEARDAEGDLTPNYGNEVFAETIQLNVVSVTYPAGGDPGSLTNDDSFSATVTPGEFENTTVSWSEVGTVTLNASVGGDADYLGGLDVTGTPSGDVGRFYPEEFVLTGASVTDACAAGSFSYMSDANIDVSYSIEARNLLGAVTTNYDNDDLAYSVVLPTIHAENNNDGVDLAGRLTIAGGQWEDGTLSVTATNSAFARAVAPDGPFSNLQLGLEISDPDGADFGTLDFKPADNNDCVTDGDCTGAEIGSTLDVNFGRMRVDNAFGPELADIPMTWQTETWNGSSFENNTADQCTSLPIVDVTFTGAGTVVDAAADTIAVSLGGVTSVFDFGDPIGADDCLTATDILFCDGQAGVEYRAPGAVVTYPVSVDLTNLPHLRYDWDQDGAHTDSPHPRIEVDFQSYRGHDRVIYWQETLQ